MGAVISSWSVSYDGFTSLVTEPSPCSMQPVSLESVLSIFIGFVFYVSLWFLSGPICQWICGSKYSLLSKNESVDLRSRVVSNVNAIVATIGSLGLFFFNTVYSVEPFEVTAPGIESFIGFCYGYFIYDFLLVLTHLESLGDKGTIIHHSLAVVSFFLVMSLRCGSVCLVAWMITEASTPFINQRLFLKALHQESSTHYTINGIMMFLSYFFCRILICIYSPLFVLDHYHSWLVVPLSIKSYTLATYVSMCVLNSYWFFLISRGLFKTVMKKRKQS